MPRDLRNEREFTFRCTSDACWQGRRPCPFPTACQTSEPSKESWFWSDVSILAIGVLVLYGFYAGWFSGIGS